MPSVVNRHGLSRDIPSNIRRQVRRDAGFGCILCGKILCHYDHFDPEYSDATEHNPDKIALLCTEHHDKKTRRVLDETLIVEAKRSPCCLRQRPQQSHLLMRSRVVVLKLFDNIFVGHFAIDVAGQRIIEVRPDLLGLLPFYLSAQLFNRNSENVFSIENSDITFTDPTWDAEVEGNRFTFRSADRQIDLVIAINENIDRIELAIERLHTCINGQTLMIDGHDLTFLLDGTNVLTMRGGQFLDCGIDLDRGASGIGVGWRPRA